MSLKLMRAIVKTLIYADIFNYPLTEEEIWEWLVKVKSSKLKVQSAIKKLKLKKEKKEYYFLKGRRKIVDIRKKREKWSREKIKIAKKIGNLLKIIPTIKLVGITGALAVENSDYLDDIDLFIVTSKRLIWTTRFFTTVLVELTGKRRRPGQSNVNNKICLNMFIDEDHLSTHKKERDLFSAHEVIQMKLLWERNNTYSKFLKANEWVENYLPNALGSIKYQVASIKYENKSLFYSFLVSLLTFFERFLKSLQLLYMSKRRTKEVIRDGVIRFHPQDARKWVMEKYHQILL